MFEPGRVGGLAGLVLRRWVGLVAGLARVSGCVRSRRGGVVVGVGGGRWVSVGGRWNCGDCGVALAPNSPVNQAFPPHVVRIDRIAPGRQAGGRHVCVERQVVGPYVHIPFDGRCRDLVREAV